MVKKSICLFCSLGCEIAFRADGSLDYVGPLCRRGHYNAEILNHPQRLTEPRIGSKRASWQEAMAFIRQEMKLFKKGEIGIMVSTMASNEDAAAAVKVAQELEIKNICAAGDPADLETYAGADTATLEDIDNTDSLLLVGDIIERTPVLARRINRVKYGKRGNKIVVVGAENTHTAWFATHHLISLEEAGQGFSGVVLIVPALAKGLVAAAKKMGAKYSVYYLGGNTLGVVGVLAGQMAQTEMLQKIDSGEIKFLLMLGEDFSKYHPALEKKFRMLKFVVCSDYFVPIGMERSDTVVTLPLASQFEGGGTYQLSGGREVTLMPIAPRVGSKTNAEIMHLLHG